VNCADFQRQNTIPLYPGKRNRWLLAHSDVNGESEGLVREQAKELVQRLLNDQAQHIELTYVAHGGSRPNLAAPVVRQREQCTIIPLVSGKVPWFVVVEFDYYQETESISWPLDGGVFCDTDSLDWLALSIGGPIKDAGAPDTIIPKEVSDAAKDVAQGAADAVKGIGSGIAVGVGFGLVVLLAAMRKR